jgi:type II secretory pathway pseudopilin PulG
VPVPVRHGIGLVEAAVATVIVGIMLVSAMATFDATMRAGAITNERSRAGALGSLLMNEILRGSYTEPTDAIGFGPEAPETAASRTDWDDVDDYDDFAQSPPTLPGGAEVDGARNWRWAAAVEFADPADPARTATLDTGLKRITVTVTDPRGAATTLVALRSRFNPRDRAVAAPTSFVGHVRVHLEVGGGFKGNLTSGTTLLNEPSP